jgi:23S rRNA (adenine2503-C2)-methyltransferase
LAAQLQSWEQPVYRVAQVSRWVYHDLVADVAHMTNLPTQLRQQLDAKFTLLPCRPLEELESEDGETRKSLLELSDGETIESVLMLYEQRRTACVSTQVGCPIGCAFCATGQSGFRRNLSTGEIVGQALHLARTARTQAPAAAERPLTNIVYMGMGEPLLNYESVWRSILLLTDAEAFGLGARHITISTAGVVPGIRRLATERLQVGLAISLHATDDALRDTLVPLNRRYPIHDVLRAAAYYVERSGRRVTIEYALIADINDSAEQAGRLVELLGGLPTHVNIIPANPTEASPYQPSTRSRVDAFVAIVEGRGIPCTVRLRRGIDVLAGCGQLRSRRETK